jgi:hypothetical protein
MANRKLKTWAEVKARRPVSAEAEAANATWGEQQIVELNLQALRQQLASRRRPQPAPRGLTKSAPLLRPA